VRLILGGSAGNLLDRLTNGEVTDYVHFSFWYVFNAADAAITVGVALLLLSTFRMQERARSRYRGRLVADHSPTRHHVRPKRRRSVPRSRRAVRRSRLWPASADDDCRVPVDTNVMLVAVRLFPTTLPGPEGGESLLLPTTLPRSSICE
jgi:hypothetical protein